MRTSSTPTRPVSIAYWDDANSPDFDESFAAFGVMKFNHVPVDVLFFHRQEGEPANVWAKHIVWMSRDPSVVVSGMDESEFRHRCLIPGNRLIESPEARSFFAEARAGVLRWNLLKPLDLPRELLASYIVAKCEFASGATLGGAEAGFVTKRADQKWREQNAKSEVPALPVDPGPRAATLSQFFRAMFPVRGDLLVALTPTQGAARAMQLTDSWLTQRILDKSTEKAKLHIVNGWTEFQRGFEEWFQHLDDLLTGLSDVFSPAVLVDTLADFDQIPEPEKEFLKDKLHSLYAAVSPAPNWAASLRLRGADLRQALDRARSVATPGSDFGVAWSDVHERASALRTLLLDLPDGVLLP